ncbi:MAG: ABC transporter permease subunit [Myxococcota bacterium]|jgi:phosphonate transport system permease protein|nr:ABC transporter permease subunit [Myxococcota bacterium]
MKEGTAGERIEVLWQERPRDRFVRASLLAGATVMVAAWGLGDFDWSDLFSARRQANLARFLEGVRPHPLQGVAWDWGGAWTWARDLFAARGAGAMATTLGISVLAISLAGLVSLVLSLPSARNFATVDPFAAPRPGTSRGLRFGWALIRRSTRGALIAMRSIPEYLAAFLLLAIFGPTPWTAVLALAVHNAGILGRLGAETIENIPSRAPASLRAIGGRRSQLAVWVLLPELLPRLLLYFFYRWETCVRESTVLGLLGIVSLGFWIDDARTRGHLDALVFYVALGVVIVIVGDLMSSLARELLRRAD